MAPTLKEIKIDTNLLDAIKKIAKRENTTENKLITEAIESIIDKKTKKSKSFWDLGGKYTTDEPFNAVEDIKKMRNGEL